MRGNAVFALGLLLMLGGCASSAPTATPSPAPTETPRPNGMTSVRAKSAMALPGVSQPFSLYTHCGLDNATIDFAGMLWDVAGQVPAPRGGGGDIAPQTGIDDPFDQGTITLTGLDRAVFIAASGVRLDLVPHPGPKDVMVCY